MRKRQTKEPETKEEKIAYIQEHRPRLKYYLHVVEKRKGPIDFELDRDYEILYIITRGETKFYYMLDDDHKLGVVPLTDSRKLLSEVLEKPKTPEDIINMEIEQQKNENRIDELYNALNQLSSTAKSRIKRYFLENQTLEMIANEDGVSIASVKESLEWGLKKLEKLLKK